MRNSVSHHRARRYLATALFVSALAIATATAGYNVLRYATCIPTLSSIKNEAPVRDLWTWMEQNIDSSETRVYFEGTLGSYEILSDSPIVLLGNDRTSHIFALTGLHTSIKQINGWSTFRSRFSNLYTANGGQYFGELEPEEATAELVDMNMRWLNCQYMVANSSKMKERLARLPFLKKVTQVDSITVYKHTDMATGWAFRMSDMDKRFPVETKRDGQEYVITADGPKGDAVIASVAYNRHWKAYVGGQPLPIERERALVKFELPKSGTSRILLRYEIEKTRPLACLGLGSLLLVAGFLLQRRRRDAPD